MPETPGPDETGRPLSRRALRQARRAGATGAAGGERPTGPAGEQTASPASRGGSGEPERSATSDGAETARPEPAAVSGDAAAPASGPGQSQEQGAEQTDASPAAGRPDDAPAREPAPTTLRFDAMPSPERKETADAPADADAAWARRSTLAEAAAAQPETPAAAPGLDELFADDDTSPPRTRRRGGGCLIALLIVAVILGGIAAGGAWAWNTYGERVQEFFGWDGPDDYEPGEATGEVMFTILEGDTGSSISPRLHEAGVTMNEDSFYDYMIRENQAPTFYPGTYRLQERMTSEAALEVLRNPENKVESTAQLREGLTVEVSLEIIAEGVGIPLEDLQAATADPAAYGVPSDSLEGWLFPATYTFPPETTAEDVIRTMVNRTIESLDGAGVPEADRQRILTIASIIQREARFENDFYRVSRVIQNRLDPANPETHGYLQMDSTAQYGYGEMHDGTASSSEEALQDDNPWNTYRHTGLPAGPIANPGDLAIDAAMHPAEGPWLYFVTVNLETGETVFTESYEEHLRAVEQWRDWCSDNPDAGC